MLEFKSKTARQTSWKSQHQHGEGLEGRRNGWLVSQARVLLAVHRMGAGELQGESKEAQRVRKYYVGSGQCSTIKVKTWRKEMSGFSEEVREVGGLD